MTRRLLLLLITTAGLMLAQPSLSLQLVTTGTIRQNQQITFNVVLSGSTGQSLAALMGTFALPGSLTNVTVTSGPASITAAKSITCGAPGTTLICILVGPNQNTYADGVVAVVTGTVSQIGSQSFGFTAAQSATAAAKGVTTSSGNPLSLSVSPLPCDVNGDGSFSAADLSLIAQQITSGNPPLSSDVNGDGKVDAVDAQRVANAIGGSCVVGP